MKPSADWATASSLPVMQFNSLSTRFLVVSTVWTVIALVLTAVLLSAVYKRNVEESFHELLTAHLYNLMGSIDLGEDGNPTGSPNLGDPSFNQPFSGWYWSVSPRQKPNAGGLKSPSMAGSSLVLPSIDEIPFKEGFLRLYRSEGFQGENISVAEAQIFLGDGDDVFRFLVSGNNSSLQVEIDGFTRSLVVFLALFGGGMVASTFVIVKYSLRPLIGARNGLNEIRNGNAEHLEGEFPKEIQPLVGEINALISSNTSIIERARTQVGNLAHALKTPISVLKNESRSSGRDLAVKVDEQANVMQQQVQHYLDRARIAAQRGAINARTPVRPVLERMIRVMQRLHPDRNFALNCDGDHVFRGEQQDIEEILGNLIENAAKYATKNVVVSVDALPEQMPGSGDPTLRFDIEDDGPGLSKQQRIQAIRRGTRLDETRPGSGLGLSIVKDIVSEYQGTIALVESKLCGLKVTISLPAST